MRNLYIKDKEINVLRGVCEMRKAIWKLMKDKGLKQITVAKAINMHPTRLSQLANSLDEPTIVEIEKLMNYFEKSESELFRYLTEY